MEQNVIVVKSKAFALRVIRLYKMLEQQHEYIMSRQLLRSGTSIGANVKEQFGDRAALISFRK